MDNEIWKDINGYEGFYQASNMGRIRSLDRKIYCRGFKKQKTSKGRILSTKKTAGLYPKVTLSVNGQVKYFKVHKLIAKTFLEQTSSKHQVNHLDGDKTNNNLENLAWVSAKENIAHARTSGLIIDKPRKGIRRLNLAEVVFFKIMKEEGFSYQRIGDILDVSRCTVSDAVTGRTWKHLSRDNRHE